MKHPCTHHFLHKSSFVFKKNIFYTTFDVVTELYFSLDFSLIAFFYWMIKCKNWSTTATSLIFCFYFSLSFTTFVRLYSHKQSWHRNWTTLIFIHLWNNSIKRKEPVRSCIIKIKIFLSGFPHAYYIMIYYTNSLNY